LKGIEIKCSDIKIDVKQMDHSHLQSKEKEN